MNISDVAVLIPSLNPDEKLAEYIDDLISSGFEKIIIVNDGSREEFDSYFDRLSQKPQCSVLRHAVNQGKGRALKTGFNYYVNTYSKNDSVGIVTADADGQHSPQDTVKVAMALKENANQLILGTRNFNEPQVPFKSRNGNKITTVVFALLYAKKINDTQTGLRGIPYDYAKRCIVLPGERFEYEINMLIEAVRSKTDITEVPIETIYYEGNRETHFNAVKDAARIYGAMFKAFFTFTISSLSSSAIDIALFALFSALLLKVMPSETALLISTFAARACSSLYNYFINRNIVFQSAKNHKSTLVKYYCLVVAQTTVSWLLVTLIFNHVSIGLTWIKIMTDVFLFVISFQIQRRWIFQ